MRARTALSILMSVWPLATAWAESFDAQSKIVAVTVFSDRAQVTRRAEVKLPKGIHEVRFAPLPGTVDEGSISAKGQGDAKAKLFGAKLITTQLEESPSPRIKEIEDQIKQLNDRAQQLHDTKEVLRQEREFLASIKAASSEQIGKDIITKQPSVTDVANLLAFLDRALSATYQKNQQADVQLREVAEQLDRLNRELNQLRGETRKQQTAIVVDLEAETSGRLTIEVSYRLSQATWQPVYEARASAQANEVELVTYGLVRQRTGEDWQDVTLQLSTARPAIGGRMPEVQPWWLRKREPIEYQRYDQAKAAKAFGGVARLAETQEMEAPQQAMAVAQATVEAQGPAMVFTLPKSETIQSDWQPRKAAIAAYTLPADFAYEVTPRLSPYAYLRANAQNHAEVTLLPGDVQVFLDGAFVGNSSINLVGPGERFDLFLGIDERIKVERKQLKAKVDVSIMPGLHGRIKTIDYEYLTTIENFRPTLAKITLIDPAPVSQHDEIKVEDVVWEPKPTEEDHEKPGVSRWLFELAAGRKQSFKLSYRVRHPVDFIVEGL